MFVGKLVHFFIKEVEVSPKPMRGGALIKSDLSLFSSISAESHLVCRCLLVGLLNAATHCYFGRITCGSFVKRVKVGGG